MKKVFLFAAMLAIAASCSVSEIDSIKGTTAPEITASYENNGTKTTITTDEEGVGTIWWKPADEINVFYGTLSTHYVSKNTENATTVAFGTTDIIGSTESASENIWGLYPYNENAVCDGESVTTTIPAAQQAIAGTFDDDIFTSLAHSTSTVMTFYNVLGGIKFSLSRDDIQTITFKGNNDEDIAGKVSLSMDANGKPVAEITEGEKTITLTPKEGTTFAKNTNYYIVMLPTVLSNGFTMTFETETAIGTFEYTTKSIEIKRSVFSKKENIDTYAEFVNKDLLPPFTITSKGSTSVSISRVGSDPSLKNISLEYAKNSDSWATYSLGSTFDLADGEFLQFRAVAGGNEKVATWLSNYHKVNVLGEGTIKVSGNIVSLLDASMQQTSGCVFCRLFYNCIKLEDASELILPTSSLEEDCYDGMFEGCKSLVVGPDLPATTLAQRCYQSMFYGCSSLATAPNLPATSLASGCYCQMFEGCTSLITAPSLSATTLATECYYNMFKGCIKLTTAPNLLATTLVEGCYNSMFSGCSGLTSAPSLQASTMAAKCYQSMFFGCTNLSVAPSLPATTLAESCYYGMFSGCTKLSAAPSLPATTLASSCYSSMFKGCTNLTSAPSLSATTLADGCYSGMFENCTSLTTTPSLPATTLAESCYSSMFKGCTKLSTAPSLTATILAYGCYNSMFDGCTGLTTAPSLPATKLAERCYYRMFRKCKNLTNAPDLPALNLTTYCYYEMFYDCSSLNYIKALFTTTPSYSYTGDWLRYASSTGTFVKNKNATWDVTGYNGIPSGWTVLTE